MICKWRFNAPRKKWELLRQEQVGRQINASVLLLINEMELSIYRFLTPGPKKNKRQPQPIELGVNWIVIGAFNALIGYHYVDQTSTRGQPGKKIPQSGRKGYWKRERVFCTPRSDLNLAKGIGRPVPWPVELVGPVPRPVQHFWPENLYFYSLFSSNT